MNTELMTALPSMGIAGLLFVMWWFERQERARAATLAQESLQSNNRTSGVNDHLLDVIRHNTEAVVALREELRSHRVAELEWLGRLSSQLDSTNQTPCPNRGARP